MVSFPNYIKIVVIVIAMACLNGTVKGQWLDGYGFRKEITIDHNEVTGSTDFLDFPFLVKTTNAELRDTINGGNVCHAQGYDIVFTSADGVTPLYHDLEAYSASTGTLLAWVNIPALSPTVDYTFYIYYGNKVISSNGSSVNTWNSNYKAVWHLHDDFEDRTSYTNDGTNNGSTNTTGKIGDAQSFDDNNQEYILIPDDNSIDFADEDFAVEFWFRTTTNGINGNYHIFSKGTNVSPFYTTFVDNANPDSGSIVAKFKDELSDVSIARSVNPYNDNQWHHFIMQRLTNVGPDSIEAYIDGGAEIWGETDGVFGSTANDEDLILGGRSDFDPTKFFNGEIDEFRITQTSHSRDWIKTNFDVQNTPENFSIYATQESAPIFTSNAILTTKEDSLYNYAIVTEDIDGGIMTITADTIPLWLNLTDNGDGTANLSGTPDNSKVGSYDIILSVNDGLATNKQEFTLTVTNTNDSAEFISSPSTNINQDDTYVYNINTIDIDIGDILTIGTKTKPSWLFFSDNGDGTALLTGTPGDNEVDTHAISLYVTEGIDTTFQNYNLIVLNINDTVYFTSSPTLTTNEDANYSYSITTFDEDEVKDTSYINADSIPTWLNLTDNGDGTALLEGIPDNSQVGSHSIVISVTDEVDSAWQSFNIIVNNVNDSVYFLSTPDTLVYEDSVYSYSIITFDEDAAKDTTFITAPVKPAWLNFIDNGDGTATLSGTPSNNDVDTHNIVLSATDNKTIRLQQFSIIVQNSNDSPEITSSPDTITYENENFNYSILTSDPDGDSVTITSNTLPDWLTLIDYGNGTALLAGTPTFSDIGVYSIKLSASDSLSSTTQEFNLTVIDQDQDVYFTSTPVTEVSVDSLYTYNITTNISSDVSINADSIPAWLEFTDNGNGTATLTGITDSTIIGEHTIILSVSVDTITRYQQFILSVQEMYDSIKIISNPVLTVFTDSTYNYTIISNHTQDVIFTPINVPSWLTITDNGNGTAIISGIPTDTLSGSFEIEVSVTDGTSIDNQIFTLTVLNTTESVYFTSMPLESVFADSLYQYNITASFLPNVVISELIVPQWLQLTDYGNSTALLTGTPSESEIGEHSIQLFASDGETSDTQVFTLAVEDPNDRPYFISNPETEIIVDSLYSYAVLTSDADMDTLTLTAHTLPEWLEFTDLGEGSAIIEGVPSISDTGWHNVQIIVNDGIAAHSQYFSIEVINIDTCIIEGYITGNIAISNDIMVLLTRSDNKETVQSTKCESTGKYRFNNLSKADYFIQAIPNPELYKKMLPTYFVQSTRWDSAHSLSVSGKILNADLMLHPYIKGVNGTGSINGYISRNTVSETEDSIYNARWFTFQTNTNNANNRNILVFLKYQNQIIDWCLTNEHGQYLFDSIYAGRYQISAEFPGLYTSDITVVVGEHESISQDLSMSDKKTSTLNESVTGIYPNPASQNINVIVKNNNTRSELFIYNLNGKLVHKESFDSACSVNISQFAAGLYIATIISANEIETHKFVKE